MNHCDCGFPSANPGPGLANGCTRCLAAEKLLRMNHTRDYEGSNHIPNPRALSLTAINRACDAFLQRRGISLTGPPRL